MEQESQAQNAHTQDSESTLKNQKDLSRGGAAALREEVVFSWRAPVRPFKKRNREFFTTVAAIGFLIALILFFLEGVLPVAVVMAIVFLVYTLFTFPPEEVEHKITNKGIYFAGTTRYLWDELRRFWFTERFENALLVIESFRAPGRLELVIKSEDKEKLAKELEKYLLQEERSPDFLDKAATWLSRRVPLEG